MGVDGGDAGRRRDGAAGSRVLAHEVDGELGSVDDAFVVDVGAEEVGFGGILGGLGIIEEAEGCLLVGTSVVENVYRTVLCENTHS